MRRAAFDPVVAGGRQCTRCRAVKPPEAFGVDRSTRDGVSRECRQCGTDRDRERAQRDPDYRRRYHLKQRYGLSLEDYLARLEAQGGGCAVCGASPGARIMHVDHDHACCPGEQTCGRCIRGILCQDCNRGLGMFQDDAELLMAAAAYVLRTSEE